ncbi:uncharacterized protein LOC132168552 [Corylus avellana]|uniref:uncharacterized protein LOC132168552 n=1 Tax=Corylus avellana TaxID=13451 RepID=UPI00286A66D6|nr:uncharacterized protein LOC132168552 [Corylus avellana]
MCRYEIEIQGVHVKVSIVDRAALVDAHIAELRSSFERLPCVAPLVAFDIKCIPRYNGAALLILCAGSHCLIVQLYYIDSFPGSLKRFLNDQNVCFVGVGVQEKLSKLRHWPQMCGCKTGVELGHLAARVLKKPNLDDDGCDLVELASEVGLFYGEPKSVNNAFSDWTARVFSHEQVKHAIYDAYASYMVANSLLSLL